MGHITSKNYLNLQKRLNDSPQGAPPSEALFKILEILFTEKEAGLVSVLPLKFFTIETAAKRWKLSEAEAEKILNELADKGLLLDLFDGKKQSYVLAPTMAGFFEFSMMRTDGRFNRKVLSELYYQYINEEDDFVLEVFGNHPTIARTFVQEPSLEPKSEILNYEKATKVIENASCITVGTCYCRHKMEHMGKACDMPQDVCLTFNNPAKSLAKHGIAKEISKKEAKEILDRCVDLGLVQIGDNVQNNVAWICNCCGCCCEAILAFKQLGSNDRLTSSFYAKFNSKCLKCGICVKKCPVDAIDLEKGVDLDKCIGCGVCVRFCKPKGIKMIRRDKTQFVPHDSFDRMVLTALDTGKIQNFIFDNYTLWTHALLRRFIGVVMNLKPTKMLLANEKFRSRYLYKLIEKQKCKIFDKIFDDPK
jgi:ferredoxin